MSARALAEARDNQLREVHEQGTRWEDRGALGVVADTLGELSTMWPPTELQEGLFDALSGRLNDMTTRLVATSPDELEAVGRFEIPFRRAFADGSFTGLYDIAQTCVGQYVRNRVAEHSVVQPGDAADDLAYFAEVLAAGGLFHTKYGAINAVTGWLGEVTSKDKLVDAPQFRFSVQHESYAHGAAHALKAKRAEVLVKTVAKAGVAAGAAGFLLNRGLRRKQ